MPSVSPVTFNRGFLSLTGLGGGPSFQLISSQLLVTNNTAGTGNAAVQSASPAQAGPHSLNATFAGDAGLGFGYAEIAGASNQKVFYKGTLTIAGSLTLTDTTLPQLVVTGAFTVTGNLQGFSIDPNLDGSPALFDRKVKGKGKAILELTTMIDNGVRLFEFSRITYLFL